MAKRNHDDEELFIVEEDTIIETEEVDVEAAAEQVAVSQTNAYGYEANALAASETGTQASVGQNDTCGCEDDANAIVASATNKQVASELVGAFEMENAAAFAAAEQVGVQVKKKVIEKKVVEELIPVASHKKEHHKRLWLLIPLLLALLLLLLTASTAFASSEETVSLKLEQHTLSEVVIVHQNAQKLAAAGAMARTVHSQPKYVPGNQAHGWLTLKSSGGACGCAVIVPAGTEFRGNDGVWVRTEAFAALGPNCIVTVPAIALPAGPIGNIRAHEIFTTYNQHIFVSNTYAFSGGTNGTWIPVVQSFSVTQAISEMTDQLNQKVGVTLQSQAQRNGLTLLSQLCTSTHSVNLFIGGVAPNATVSVSTKCSGRGYSVQNVLTRARQEFQQQGQLAFGNDYTLSKLASKELTSVTIDHQSGAVTAMVSATGQWKYQFKKTQKQEIASILKGKSLTDALDFLDAQRGIAAAHITTSGFLPMLPFLASNIKVVIK